jgi:hypothetical protein
MGIKPKIQNPNRLKNPQLTKRKTYDKPEYKTHPKQCKNR